MMRKHGGGHAEFEPTKTAPWSIPSSQQPSFYLDYMGSHAYKTTHHPNLSTDEIKKTEILQDTMLEGLRKISEMNRLTNEFVRNSTPQSILNEATKLFMIQMVPDLFQGTRTMPTTNGLTMPAKKEILPSGYRISLCDTCLLGCEFRPAIYPIDFEALTKLLHECDSKKLFVGQNQNEVEILEKKRQVKASLGDMLSQIVRFRIGRGDAYLKARKLSQNAFGELSEETQSKWAKLPPNRSRIEERDCIKFNPSKDTANADHWFYRTIREHGKDSNVKVTQSELTEFLRIANATFGVFQVNTNDPAKKCYFLIYLML